METTKEQLLGMCIRSAKGGADMVQLVTVKELCSMIGISRATFYRRKLADKFTAYKVGKSIRYDAADIKKLKI